MRTVLVVRKGSCPARLEHARLHTVHVAILTATNPRQINSVAWRATSCDSSLSLGIDRASDVADGLFVGPGDHSQERFARTSRTRSRRSTGPFAVLLGPRAALPICRAITHGERQVDQHAVDFSTALAVPSVPFARFRA